MSVLAAIPELGEDMPQNLDVGRFRLRKFSKRERPSVLFAGERAKLDEVI